MNHIRVNTTIVDSFGNTITITSRRSIFSLLNFFGVFFAEFIGGIDYYNDLNTFPPLNQNDISRRRNSYINYWIRKIFNTIKFDRNNYQTIRGSPYLC